MNIETFINIIREQFGARICKHEEAQAVSFLIQCSDVRGSIEITIPYEAITKNTPNKVIKEFSQCYSLRYSELLEARLRWIYGMEVEKWPELTGEK